MISIITVAHRSQDLLTAYVDSFLEHNARYANQNRFEFILIENSGDARIAEHVARLEAAGFAARYEMTENHGFGTGCNVGATLASGDLLVFANPDMRFTSDLGTLEEAFGHDRWGTVGQTNESGRINAFDLRPEHRSLTTDLLRLHRHLHRLPWLYRYSYVVGSFMIVPRAVFAELGGFDERFFLYYEEVELARRLQARLGLPLFVPSISILHEAFGTQGGKPSDFTFEQEAISMVKYAQIIGQPGLAERRMRTLRQLKPLSETAGIRADFLERAISQDAQAARVSIASEGGQGGEQT